LLDLKLYAVSTRVVLQCRDSLQELALSNRVRLVWVPGHSGIHGNGRHEWVLLSRFRTTQGRCASLMHRWGYVDSPVCECVADQQTMSHIVNECPIRRFNGGLIELSEADPNAISFLENLDMLL
jgi:hypothetical protein